MQSWLLGDEILVTLSINLSGKTFHNKNQTILDDNSDLLSAIRSSIGDKIFSVGIMIWSIHDFIQLSELNKMLPSALPNYFRFTGLFLVMLSIVTRKFFKLPAVQTTLMTVLLIFFMSNNGMLTGDNHIWLDLVIMIFGSLGINYSKFFGNIALFRILLNTLLILLALLGRIPNDVSVVDTRIRFNLGYTWTSFAAHTLLFIVLLLMWRYKDKAPLWLYFALGIVNIWIYQKTNTKSPFALVFLVLILWFLFSKVGQENVQSIPLRLGIVFLFPALMVLIYYLSLHSGQYSQLDELLSGRLTLGHTYISQYGLTLFGHHIYDSTSFDAIGQTYQTLDSSMMRYIIKYGVVSAVVFNIAWCFTTWRITSKGNIYYDLVFVVLALEAFSDPWFLYPSYNIFIILLGTMIFNQEDLLNLLE
ncbi:hypothetical protein IWT140_02314 [Secundilactobacillus pentosiphilus]|uniref:Polymerase n=1 Tax=Secundilactobacillus pentosiphilus TaxID=1714682 RepID=A0A1Z5ITB5_9LACO|nr:polymerase [Secundilactobacillus pentosiphilus]GAX04671.1 hypothetical protein IWT140_02314 [Secundilactobacillus pentosiphilus]